MRILHHRMTRYIGVFVLSILVRWLILCLAWLLKGEQPAGLWSYLLPFLSQAGDAPHYLQIAEYGYLSSGDTMNNVVFYPLYPLLIRLVSLSGLSLPAAGMLVSNLCLGGAGLAVWLLAGQLTGKPQGTEAWMTLLLFLCYPFAMFLTGIYTESLFILLSALCLLMLYRDRWLAAGVLGLLASMSRAQGIVLLLPAVYEWLIRLREKQAHPWRRLLSLLLIPLGTGVFLLLNWRVTGNALAFVEYEALPPWYNTTRWISGNLASHLDMALGDAYLGIVIYWPQALLYFAGVAAIIWGICRGERTSFLAYGGAYICVSYLHGWLISGPRYMLSCLPLYLLAARMKDGPRLILLCLSVGLGIAYMVMYLSGGAIM